MHAKKPKRNREVKQMGKDAKTIAAARLQEQ